MKSLAQQIIEARLAAGWTQRQLAMKADVAMATVYRVEAGQTKSGPAIKAIKRALGFEGLTTANLDDWQKLALHHSRNFDSNVEQPPRVPIEIPEWESEVGAGHWVDCITAQLDGEAQREVIERGRFIIRIRGDSMEPLYRSGDRVLFRIIRLDREGLQVGADYCFQNSDGQCTLKRLQAILDDAYVLTPLNKRYQPLQLPKQLLAQVSIVETIVRAPWE